MTGLKVIDGTPTAISKYLRDKELEDKIKRIENLPDELYEKHKELKELKAELNGRKDKEKEMLDKFLKIVEEEMKIDEDMPTLKKHVEQIRTRIKLRLKERLQKLKGDKK